MAWTAPMTATLNGTFTAAQWNTHVRDNLKETAPGKFTKVSQYLVTSGANELTARQATRASVSSEQSTTSTSYTDLSTPGPSVTLTTGTVALVGVHCLGTSSGASAGWYASYAVSGSTTVAASDTYAVQDKGTHNSARTIVELHTGLTAGSNTFTMKYRADASTGTFRYRRITVMPLS